MASSSSSSQSSASASSSSYDVFLSFRGEDTRKTFVDHLCSALVLRPIRTYKDDETLPRGVSIAPSLFKAIRQSRIAVIIFSKNYADSSWCLDELEYIMKCKDEIGLIVMPVFYDVDPSDIREQKGDFGKGFAKQEANNITKMESWRKALVDASNLPGWEPKNIANGHESKVIKEIADTVFDRLIPSISDDGLVGMRTRLQEMGSLIYRWLEYGGLVAVATLWRILWRIFERSQANIIPFFVGMRTRLQEVTHNIVSISEGYQEILNVANPIVASSSSSSKITAFIKESKDLFIPFQVIEKATNNFTTVLGNGGYGVVYKGELLLSGELTTVAVKQLDRSNISGQGFKEFLIEIQLLSRYKHPNVVSLLGFCDEAGEKILIYEYAEHRSLDQHLPAAKTARPLTWEQRISICLDTARGLDYLHNHIPRNHRVIHRDIKSANILIGLDWKAMIADLGLSKIGRANESDSYLITNASGTYGYCDPAYMDTGFLTKESDVYSFGVVMFEVLCGRLCFIKVDNEHRFLARLAPRYYETGRLNEIIDPYLKTQVDSDSLKRFSEIAYPCLLNERDRRPSMGLVVQKLEEMMASSKVL